MPAIQVKGAETGCLQIILAPNFVALVNYNVIGRVCPSLCAWCCRVYAYFLLVGAMH